MLTLSCNGKTYTNFNGGKSIADFSDLNLHLSFGDKRDEANFLIALSHFEHHGNVTINYFGDNRDRGNHNNGDGNPNNGGSNPSNGCGVTGNNGCGDNGNSGCGNNGNGIGNDGGGTSATPEPSAVYLSFVAAGLMSLMLVRRGLRLRKAAAGIPA
jgi:hypothetical protein